MKILLEYQVILKKTAIKNYKESTTILLLYLLKKNLYLKSIEQSEIS